VIRPLDEFTPLSSISRLQSSDESIKSTPAIKRESLSEPGHWAGHYQQDLRPFYSKNRSVELLFGSSFGFPPYDVILISDLRGFQSAIYEIFNLRSTRFQLLNETTSSNSSLHGSPPVNYALSVSERKRTNANRKSTAFLQPLRLPRVQPATQRTTNANRTSVAFLSLL